MATTAFTAVSKYMLVQYSMQYMPVQAGGNYDMHGQGQGEEKVEARCYGCYDN